MPRVTAEQFVRIVESKMKQVVEEGRQIVKDNGEYGAELVRDVVETSGTMKSGKAGRIDTGAMLGSVGDDYDEFPNGAESTYGFLNGPDYTKYQEFGDSEFAVAFDGMFAVDDAHSNIEVDFRRDIDRMMNKIWGS